MSSEVRKPSALVSLTATYSDSESDNESDNNSNDNNSNNESNQSLRDLKLNQNNPTGSRPNLAGSRLNSPSNAFFSSIESLDERKDLMNRSDSYNDDECLDIRPNSPLSFHKSLFGKSEDQIVIPSEPIDRCSRSLQEKIYKLHEKMKMGYDMNTIIQKRKDFRNPSIYEKLIAYCGIDEMASNYPQDIYDPHKWDPESYYEELAKRQKEDLERREKERKEKTKVEFISGTKKGHNENSNDSVSKKKSKWDLPNVSSNSNTNPSQINLMRPQIVIPVTVASGTKPTVISAFGTIAKKQK